MSDQAGNKNVCFLMMRLIYKGALLLENLSLGRVFDKV